MASFPWVFPYGEDLVSRTSAVTDRVILRPFVTIAMVGQEEQSVLALVTQGPSILCRVWGLRVS
jgi:hypothetical protein